MNRPVHRLVWSHQLYYWSHPWYYQLNVVLVLENTKGGKIWLKLCNSRNFFGISIMLETRLIQSYSFIVQLCNFRDYFGISIMWETRLIESYNFNDQLRLANFILLWKVDKMFYFVWWCSSCSTRYYLLWFKQPLLRGKELDKLEKFLSHYSTSERILIMECNSRSYSIHQNTCIGEKSFCSTLYLYKWTNKSKYMIWGLEPMMHYLYTWIFHVLSFTMDDGTSQFISKSIKVAAAILYLLRG